jgi:hypothetical protein
MNSAEYEQLKQLAVEMNNSWKDQAEARHSEIRLLQQKLKARQSGLIDAYMDGVLDREAYFAKKEELLFEDSDLRSRVERLQNAEVRRASELEEFLELANSAYLSYKSAPAALKRDLVKSVTSNLTAVEKSVVVKLKPSFEVLATRGPFTAGSPRPETARTLIARLSQIISEDYEFKNFSKFSKPQSGCTADKSGRCR